MTLEWHFPQCIAILEPVSWVLFALNVWIICRTRKTWPVALSLSNLIFRDCWIIQLRHFNEGNSNELQNIESSYFFEQNSLFSLEFENRNISLKVWLERGKRLRPQRLSSSFLRAEFESNRRSFYGFGGFSWSQSGFSPMGDRNSRVRNRASFDFLPIASTTRCWRKNLLERLSTHYPTKNWTIHITQKCIP